MVSLDGGEWSASHPRSFIPAKSPRYPLYVSQSPSGLFEKKSVARPEYQGIVPPLSSPQSLYRSTLY